MKTFSLQINKIPRARLCQVRTWVAICILLLVLAESMAGYVLCSFYHDPVRFSQAYTSGNSTLETMHMKARRQTESLLDFDQQSAKKPVNQAPFTMSFNLFIDHYHAHLPRCVFKDLSVKSNFQYNLLYDFKHCKDIMHPPRWISSFSLFIKA